MIENASCSTSMEMWDSRGMENDIIEISPDEKFDEGPFYTVSDIRICGVTVEA
jgi:hypothetical protein